NEDMAAKWRGDTGGGDVLDPREPIVVGGGPLEGAGAMRDTTEAAPQALPGDGLREGIVDELRRHLGEALVDTELKPNDDLWVRVSTEAWKPAAEALEGIGFEYFCFLSAIDWMPSPYGRGEDD